MRTRPTLLLVTLALVGCGSPPAATTGPNQPGGLPEPAVSDVLKVVCEDGRTRVETPRVRAFADGVHAHFENPAGADEYWLRNVTSPEMGNHGGRVPDGRERWGWADPPGEYLIACFEKGDDPPFYDMDPRYARYEVVDVDGLWISWFPDCEDPEKLQYERIEDARSFEDVEAWIRDRFWIEEGVRVRPGYPDSLWKGDPWVIRHEGRTLVHFHAMEDDVGWVVLRAEGCPSYDQPEAAPSDEPIATSLHVVCDGDRTYVTPTRVKPTEGGNEVTFDNPSGADEYWVRAASSPDDWNHGGRVPDRSQSTRWSDPPGHYLVMCNARGEDPPYYEDDERYARFEVVDPDDLWVEYEAECDNVWPLEDEPVPGATSEDEVEQWIRDHFGLHDAERRKAGYPWTEWKADAPVLTRGDQTMAGWFAYEEQGEWLVRGTACDG